MIIAALRFRTLHAEPIGSMQCIEGADAYTQ